MRFFSAIVALAAMVPSTFAALPTQAEGFASSTTGGKGGSAVYPKTNAELVKYLGDNTARIIYLDRTFNFIGTEGTASESGCLPWGTGSQCQTAVNKNDWCKVYQPKAPTTTVKYDKAGVLGITVGSNKSLIGVGSKGLIRGKGLRIVSGAKNVIIQNIHITDLNPHTVWGGDALTINDADLIWIDHVTTSLISRQHLVLGEKASNRVSVTNSKFDGNSKWSANCNSYHYWGIYFTGANDMITFKNNYIYHMSGRAPKVSGNTLLHAVNNYFHDVWDHAFEIDAGAQILAEGNVFQNVKLPVQSGFKGRLYSVVNSAAANVCKSALGRVCQLNGYGSSGAFDGTDSGFLNNFKGKNIASASSYNDAKNAQTKSGFGVA